MAYTILDLLDKAINICEKRKTLYTNAVLKIPPNSSTHIFMNVMIKNMDKNIQYYKSLKLEINEVSVEEINFLIYDKISFLINEFDKKIFIPENLDTINILNFSLNIEKDILALFIDIQGRLIVNKEDVNTKAYKIVSKLISHRKKIVKDLQVFIESYLPKA